MAIFTAIATFVALALFEVGVTYFTAIAIGQVVSAFVIAGVIGRVFGPKGQKGPEDPGARQQVPADTKNTIPVCYGDVRSGGALVDAVLSSDNSTLFCTFAISEVSDVGVIDFPTTTVTASGTTYSTYDFYLDGRQCVFDAGASDKTTLLGLLDGAGNYDTKPNGFYNVYLYRSQRNASGTWTLSGVNTSLMPWDVVSVANGAPAAAAWSSTNRVMPGLAFAIVKVKYSRENNVSSVGTWTWRMTQWLNNTATCKPGDAWYDIMTNERYGAGIDYNQVDNQARIDLNAYADQLVTYTPVGGGTATQPRYRINGFMGTGARVADNLQDLLACCDSWLTYNNVTGLWSVRVNQQQSATFDITPSNMIGNINITAIDLNSTPNQIRAEFPSKMQRDAADFIEIDLFQEAPNLLAENEPINITNVNYKFTNDPVQAQLLARRTIKQAREELIVSVSMDFSGTQIDAGDVVTVTDPNYGWTAKLFRVTKVTERTTEQGGLFASIDMLEYNADVYTDEDLSGFMLAPNSGFADFSIIGRPIAPTISNVQQTNQVPSFEVNVTVPAFGNVAGIRLFVTMQSSPTSTDWTLLTTLQKPDGTAFQNSSVVTYTVTGLPAGTYYFSATCFNTGTQSQMSLGSLPINWAPSIVSAAGTIGFEFSPPVAAFSTDASLTPLTNLSTPLGLSVYSGTNIVTLSTATTDAAMANNTWRIGSTATTSNDWTATNLTVAPGTNTSTQFVWTITGISMSQAFLTAPIRYKDAAGVASGVGVGRFVASLLASGASPGINVPLYVFKRAASPPTSVDGTWVYTFDTGALVGTGSTWSQTIPSGTDLLYAAYGNAIRAGNSTTPTTTITWSNPYQFEGQNGQPGQAANQTTIVYLYQWNPTQPPAPRGTGSYIWATGALSYTAATGSPADGWSTTISAFPGGGAILWQAALRIVAPSTTQSSSIDSATWQTSAVSGVSAAGANGLNVADAVIFYQTPVPLASPAPAVPSGSSTYTWATGAISNVPSGWATTPPSTSLKGVSIYKCTVRVVDSATQTSTTFTWANGGLVTIETYIPADASAGTIVSRVAFNRYAGLVTPSGTLTTTGTTSFPAAGDFGVTWPAAWSADPPTLVSGDNLYLCDGVINGTNTFWSTPYLATLRVGTLSAISATLGDVAAGSYRTNTSSTQRVEINYQASNRVNIFNAGNMRIATLGGTGGFSSTDATLGIDSGTQQNPVWINYSATSGSALQINSFNQGNAFAATSSGGGRLFYGALLNELNSNWGAFQVDATFNNATSDPIYWANHIGQGGISFKSSGTSTNYSFDASGAVGGGYGGFAWVRGLTMPTVTQSPGSHAQMVFTLGNTTSAQNVFFSVTLDGTAYLPGSSGYIYPNIAAGQPLDGNYIASVLNSSLGATGWTVYGTTGTGNVIVTFIRNSVGLVTAASLQGQASNSGGAPITPTYSYGNNSGGTPTTVDITLGSNANLFLAQTGQWLPNGLPSPTGAANRIPYFDTSTVPVLITNSGLTYNGVNLTCGGDITAFSDAKWKSDIATLDPNWSLTLLDQIDAKRFKMHGRVQIGFIAQDIVEHVPEVVVDMEDGKTLSYQKMTALLWAQNQALLSRIEKLEKDIGNSDESAH